jgi:hypothetical protein
MKTPPRSLLLLSFLILAISRLSSPLSAHSRDRIISWPVRSNDTQMRQRDGEAFANTHLEAVEIVGFEVAGVPVVPEQRFFAGEDWLKDLTVRVKNLSDRPASAIRMMFSFPESRYEKNGREYTDGYTLAYYSLGYGEGSSSSGFSEKGAVMPGEEVELVCKEDQYRIDTQSALRRTGVSSISAVRFGGVRVDFSNGTIWIGGRPQVRSGKDEIK